MFTALRNRIPNLPTISVPGRPARRKGKPSIVHAMSYHWDKFGNLKWVEPGWQHNLLHAEGEQFILGHIFDTDNAFLPNTYPSNFYIGLDARAAIADADDLSDLSGEPSGSGYARKAVSTETGFTLSDSGDFYVATSASVEFEASGGDWSEVTNRFLTTAASSSSPGVDARLIATVPLQTPRTLLDGDKLTVNIILGLADPEDL